jgi:hypothetical protein
MKRPFTQMRPIGPLFASINEGERLQSIESDLQTLADLISEDFDTEAPTVKVWSEDVWIQIARRDAMGNYDNFRKQINMKEGEIKYNIFIHEYAHHLINNSEDITMKALDVDEDSMRTVNEAQAEIIAEDMVDKEKLRRGWNELMANGYGGVEKV